jgi:hypothetical protein
MQMTQATLVSKVVAAANDRGARGEERTLVRLRDEAIAEQQGLCMPSFFAYIFRFSVPILLPVLVIIWLLFFAFA